MADITASEKLADWAIATLNALPPSQSLIAFLIILALALPLIRGGLRHFRSPSPQPVPEPLIQQTPWLITTLSKIDLQTQEAQRDIDAIERALGQIHRDISGVREVTDGIAKLLRARKNRRRGGSATA